MLQLLRCPIVTTFSLGLVIGVSCGPAQPESGAGTGNSAQASEPGQAPLALDWQGLETAREGLDLQIGESSVAGAELRAAMNQLHNTYTAWGPCSLAWHLLDGGMAPAALLHDRFATESETARSQAEAAVGRLREGESFYAILQEVGEAEPAVMNQPSPFGLGAETAASVAMLEPGGWAGPLRTLDGWEVVLLEERAEGVRSRSGVLVRRLIYAVADDAARNQARQDWATLPLAGDLALLRSLPRNFVRGRVAAAPQPK